MSEHDELIALRKEVGELRKAAPVMLACMALLADECDVAGLRETVLWYEDIEPRHIEVWLDAVKAADASTLAVTIREGE